ncbi:hypothetical protein B9Z19DRAFT_253989 [Tuber borchii]|uniref:Uncharacterized protein n=1 Tax=Tuber borchii TaxID=42251 RepID=A0A2T7A5G0_TUBBO|nr:hypothetical protein B9Z19DRAFT_253989 [Tuber borchii]
MLISGGFFFRDFPQCYDYGTSDDLLNSIAEKLGLTNPTTFKDAHSERVGALSGRGCFRTGLFLRAPFKKPAELSKSGSSKDRITLYVSLPYFGKSSRGIQLGPESESVELLDFKRLEVDLPHRRALVREEIDDVGEVIVHQARYMIFDNHTMATFRSKEESAKNQVPLHRFQERIGAFRAMIHMIANRMDSELWPLGKLQASLCKLEEDIDQTISGTGIPDSNPQHLESSFEPGLSREEILSRGEGYERARQSNIEAGEQRSARDLLASLNRLSASLFATVSVAERQIAILRDLHSVFLTSYRTKTKDYEKGSRLRQNPFYKNVATIPVLSENPEQIWTNALDTIDEVVRERKCFIKKTKVLVENMEIRRKILFEFLRSNNTGPTTAELFELLKSNNNGPTTAELFESLGSNNAEPTAAKLSEPLRSGPTAAELFEFLKSNTEPTAAERIVDAMERTRAIYVRLAYQAIYLAFPIIVFTAFLPLIFCASYFGMNNIKEFRQYPLSLRQFWVVTCLVCIGVLALLLAVAVIFCRRRIRSGLKALFVRFRKRRADDIENQRHRN